MRLQSLLPLSLLGLTSLTTARYSINLPPLLSTGPITADYRTPSLDQSDLDSPKLPRANESTLDWWHFDAIAVENPNASVAITFSNAGPGGFPLALPNASYVAPNGTTSPGAGMLREGEEGPALWAHIVITFPDGRSFRHVQAAESARIHGSGDSSVAIWHGAGGWMGSEEGYEVEIIVNQPGVNVTGGISMERVTEPHTLCSTPTNFSNALALGNAGLGWVGVMPDAMARVDVTVNGERLAFEGYGYHDKVWSTRPFTSSVGTLHRGRAHLGLYSLLWLSYAPAGANADPETTIVSSFLARDGETISAGCDTGSLTITPGTEQTEGGLVSGFQIAFPGAAVSVADDNELAGMGEGEAEGLGWVSTGRGHTRWNGRARGLVEGVDEEGVAIFERFEY
ncbi:uncharacterized protein BDV17DRAFT_300812 [Aspergillus undulatus]|uniref:uncharacterized protein n=1 Tax=Aspergillus undulatus TaxID=1810928 RepID=UPI003CCD9B15